MNQKKKMKLSSKLVITTALILVLTVIVLSLITYFTVSTAHDRIMTVTREKLDTIVKSQVECIIGVLEVNHLDQVNGKISVEEEKSRAENILRSTRYNNGTGYFWADLSDGTNAVHIKPEIEGTNRFDSQDEKGNYFVRDTIDAGNKPDGGFIEYYFTKPGETEALLKRGYVKKFEPYGWYIGTGNYQVDMDVLIQDEIQKINEENVNLIFSIGITGLALIVLGVLLITYLIKSALNPLRQISQMANRVSSGEIIIEPKYNSDDEIGKISGDFIVLTNTIQMLVDDLKKMAAKHKNEGDIDYFIDSNKYSGEFKTVIEEINNMVGDYSNNIAIILEAISRIASGDFETKMQNFVEKKSYANKQMEVVRNNLINVKKSVLYLVNAALTGELDKRVDITEYNGDWKKIIEGMNDVLNAVAKPLDEISNVMNEILSGNLNVNINGNYEGDFLKVKNTVNAMVLEISSYINEISSVLVTVSKGDLTKTIERNYVGDFSAMKNSLNTIVQSLNSTITEMNSVSEQVLLGAHQISSTSMSLAQGATEQSKSISEITATMDLINVNLKNNAINADTVAKYSSTAIDNAQLGSNEMKNLLTAIGGIKDSSMDISKIIKVIDEIAFQTNLLALNAAVEAARAGQHGKGFAVVAEEVRSLAAKCQEAAKETSILIETSINRVDNGVIIANSTSNALNAIIDNVGSISNSILNINSSSKEQANSIAGITEGLSLVSSVVQENTATSEEAAAASEELNSQAEILSQQIRFFKI